jgi:acyl-CoA synthetase (AMP-forming)/AMP-acid ligase II
MRTLLDSIEADAETHPREAAYLFHGDRGDEEILTRAELWRRIRCASEEISHCVSPGDRVLVAHPPGLDFNVSLLACMHAGAIAVPMYPPTLNLKLERINAVVADCKPALAIGESRARAAGDLGLRWISADGRSGTPGRTASRECGIALLQYTSGSTAAPKGVVITHANLLSNCACIKDRFQPTRQDRAVFWLPPYHDMGLIGGVLASLVHGVTTTLMSPSSFLRRPFRWLELVSRTSATISGAPNFAYALCARRITDTELGRLDLSSWKLAFCGAEPVDANVLRTFAARFSRCGFSEQALYPCYGLAEATLVATGPARGTGLITRVVNATVLEAHGVATHGTPSSRPREFVACGSAPRDHEVLIVGPEDRQALDECRVGEIWLRGPSVAAGYWQKPGATEEAFHAVLQAPESNDRFLRTGDLGFIEGGNLFVVGRLNEVVNFAGRNLYPEDVESTARTSHPLLGDARIAAFGLNDGVVMVIEIDSRSGDHDLLQAKRAVGRAIYDAHGVTPHHVSFVHRNSIPLTTSGKLRRNECRDRFAQGLLNEYA